MKAAKHDATKPPQRERLIKLIHVAKRNLCLEDAVYRTILREAGRADSTASMGVPALEKVLERLKQRGFVPTSKAKARPSGRTLTQGPEASKIRALWLFLHHLGEVRDPSEKSLGAYVKRIVRVDDLRFARPADLPILIETLKKWAMRVLPAVVRADLSEAGQLLGPALRVELEKQGGGESFPVLSVPCAAFIQAGAILARGEAYDVHWQAWEQLQVALGRVVPAGVREAGSL